MIAAIKELLFRYRFKLIYLFVGALTSLVNFLVYVLAAKALCLHYIVSNVIAWVVAVLFAYIANRIWVFRSKNLNILREAWLFLLTRIFSLILETGLLFLLVEYLRLNDIFAKIAVAVIIVVCNYLTGKWIVFKWGK